MKNEKESWEKKEIMYRVGGGITADIIKINIGGGHFATKRSTVTQVENSLHAKMFSCCSEDIYDQKEDCYFLDLDPVCFGEVLVKLREQVMTGKRVC